MRELVVDNFAGGGGASTGIEAGMGRAIDVAINHDAEAVAMHRINHPDTLHLCQSVTRADPRDVVRQASERAGSAKALPVGLAWFSPDCKHFSKAKGGKPVEKHIRDLAWVVIHWAKLVRPRVIMLENVEEFRDWGPLIEAEDGKLIPCPLRKGLTFRRWVRELTKLGYKVENRELRACDYGAPTSRKRLFVIARCDGQPIVWPAPTHGPGRPKPWRTAAEIIDWSIPCPSIFERKRPLADNTMRRIAHGVRRYVLETANPFIVPVTHAGDSRVHGVDEPLRTVTTAHRGELALVQPFLARTAHGEVDKNGKRRGRGQHDIAEPIPTVTASNDFAVVTPFLAGVGGRMGQSQERPVDTPYHTTTSKADTVLVAPTLIQTGYGEREGQAPRVPGLDKPLGTAVAGGQKHALVAAFLAQHNTGMVGHDAREPVSTITMRGTQQQLVTSHLISLKGTDRRGRSIEEPVPTITSGGWHVGEVRAFLIKYFGTDQDPRLSEPLHTVTTKDRFGIVTVHGVDYVIADIGMRMLTPRELFNAQGFPADYQIAFEHAGRPLPKSSQVRMCGNSVCPPLSEALVRANYSAADAQRTGEQA